MSGVAFGNSPDDNGKKFAEPVYTIIDTSSPYISISEEYFDAYISALFSEVDGSDYQIEQG